MNIFILLLRPQAALAGLIMYGFHPAMGLQPCAALHQRFSAVGHDTTGQRLTGQGRAAVSTHLAPQLCFWQSFGVSQRILGHAVVKISVIRLWIT